MEAVVFVLGSRILGGVRAVGRAGGGGGLKTIWAEPRP
jgi:hypothetical protein